MPRTTDEASTVSETASSMTEANMRRIRERAQWGSEERKTRRRKEEEDDELQPARSSFGFL
jgi:hypothetical protein